MNLYPVLVKSYFQTTLGALLHHLKLEIFLHTSVILHIFQPPSLSVYSVTSTASLLLCWIQCLFY